MLNVTKRQERILREVLKDHLIDVNDSIYAYKVCEAAYNILHYAHRFSKFSEVPYHEELLACIKLNQYK